MPEHKVSDGKKERAGEVNNLGVAYPVVGEESREGKPFSLHSPTVGGK